MKVLLINGSPRENGNTFTALSEVAKTLNSEGIDTEIIMRPTRPCILFALRRTPFQASCQCSGMS